MMQQKLQIVVLYSGGCSAVKFLAEPGNDDAFGKSYEIVAGVSDKSDANGHALLDDLDIPHHIVSFTEWMQENGVTKDCDIEYREPYFDSLCDVIDGYNPDLIMCSGFMLIMPDTFISHYKNRIINVHPGDLRIMAAAGGRLLIGDDAVQKANQFAIGGTHSTVHVIEPGRVDHGQIVAISPGLRFPPGKLSDEQLEKHQEHMKTACDGPAYVEALRLIRTGAHPIG